MGECLILKSGEGFDDSEVTAKPENAMAGKIFMGAGSDEPQTGTIQTVAKVVAKLGVNQAYNITPGYHAGEDVISQTGIITEPGPIIDPVAGGQTVQVVGRYLTSDTTVQSIDNLRPEVIKVGVTIADITGNYQGFPDEE